mmetsp:Transcript_72515/g.172902  ORF Transcript_72515/g.172902 Transcript_72515/m.172902 type:complete len:457 (-) Transcript_72515:112-1482(-)
MVGAVRSQEKAADLCWPAAMQSAAAAASNCGGDEPLSWVGSLDAVLQAMTANQSVADIQVSGCKVLLEWLMSLNGSSSAVNSNNTNMISAEAGKVTPEFMDFTGLLQAVLQAMRGHTNIEEVQLAGLQVMEWVMLTMATAKAGHNTILQEKETIARVIVAMESYPKAASLQGHGCAVLRRIAMSSAEAQEFVISHGGARAIVNAMNLHPADAVMQAAACRTLKELAAYSAAGQREVASCGGIAAVLAAMQTHHNVITVQESACGVLRNISACNAAYQGAVVSAGGIEVVLQAMAEHEKSASVQCSGCWALFCITVHNRETQRAVVWKGALDVISWAMEEHCDDIGVQEAACFALKELASANVGQDVPREARASIGAALVSKINAALRRHSTVPKVQTAGSAALKAMLVYYAEGNAKATAVAAAKHRCRVDANRQVVGRRTSGEGLALPAALPAVLE